MTGLLEWVARSGVVQGIIIGATLAYLTAIAVMKIVGRKITTSLNGWDSMVRVGQPGNGILARAASAKALPVVNVFEEAAYWTTTTDGDGAKLTGAREYVLRFAPGQLPPNSAFWSLAVTDVAGYIVSNSRGPSSLNDRSNLDPNADGSIDIHLQPAAPEGRQSNWLATPGGRFKLMLRAYLPGAAILDGTYRVPPVVRTR